MKIAMEEIFGPVQVILKYKTIDEVRFSMLDSCRMPCTSKQRRTACHNVSPLMIPEAKTPVNG
jgi:hypothetical protein